MKTLITLGLALVAFTNNANAETTLVKGVNADYLTVAAVKAEQFENLLTVQASDKRKLVPVEDSVLNPETVIIGNNYKTIEEVIAEDNKIIESTFTNDGMVFFFEKTTEEVIADDNKITDSNITTEISMLHIEKSTEEVIADDNAIIEGNVADEAQNLDFEKINRSSVLVKQVGNLSILGMN